MPGLNDIRGLTPEQIAMIKPKPPVTLMLANTPQLDAFMRAERRIRTEIEDDSRWTLPEFGGEW